MRNLLIIFLVLVCLQLKATSLSVVTYNVNYALVNENISIILDSINADVVCLQETNAKWELLLKVKLQHRYPYMEFKHCCTAGGLAILSKYPITKTNYLTNQAGWFPGMLATIEKEGTIIQLLNLHLKPGLTKKGRVGWNAHFKKGEIHQKELKAFLRETDNAFHRIVVGDFNENDKGKAIKWLQEEKAYLNALPQFDKKTKTWRFGILRSRYDHILYAGFNKCTDAKVFKVGKSDHFPVFAQFEL